EIVLGEVRLNLTWKVLHVRTGRLRQSVHRSHQTGTLTATIGTNVVYARIHEFGGRTKPHKIEAKNAKALGPFVRQGQGSILRLLEAVGPGVRTKKGAFSK